MMRLVKTKLQNGLVMWYRSDDKYIGQKIALQKYEEYESQLILQNVNKDSVVIDVGANIGYYTLLLAKVCKKVYAFEPDKNCFEILKKNIDENKLKNVVLFNLAVSDKKEKAEFIIDKENLGNSRIQTPQSSGQLPLTGEHKTILCESLDNFIKNEKVDLIKIDVQGHEPKVILGAKRIIKKYKPILFLEYSPTDYRKNNLDGRGMVNFLKQTYKQIFTIDYWFYVLKSGIRIDPKTGYADLVLGIKTNIWERYKNVQWKKVIKNIFNL